MVIGVMGLHADVGKWVGQDLAVALPANGGSMERQLAFDHAQLQMLQDHLLNK